MPRNLSDLNSLNVSYTYHIYLALPFIFIPNF